MPVQETATRLQIAELIEAYRQAVTTAQVETAEDFVELAHNSPDEVAAEAVDYAADTQDVPIDYNWDRDQPIRDILYTAAGTWARHLTVERLAQPVRPEDLTDVDPKGQPLAYAA